MNAVGSTVTVHMVASVDGFIEAPGGDMTWFETADRYEEGVDGENPEEFLKTITGSRFCPSFSAADCRSSLGSARSCRCT